MAKTEVGLSNRAIKNKIIRLIEYRIFSIKYNIYDLGKGKATITHKKILPRLETEKSLLENCLTWMSKQQGSEND